MGYSGGDGGRGRVTDASGLWGIDSSLPLSCSGGYQNSALDRFGDLGEEKKGGEGPEVNK